MNRNTLLCLLTPCLLTTACGTELDSFEHSSELRAASYEAEWHVVRDQVEPELQSCDDYWDQRCAELDALQCSIVRNRFVCTPEEPGLRIVDSYARPTLLSGCYADWTGVEILDAVWYMSDCSWTMTGEHAAASAPAKELALLCDELEGIEPGYCLGLTRVAELARERQAEISQAFPGGGLASVRVEDGQLVLGALDEDALDNPVVRTIEDLDWRAPLIEGEFVLGESGEHEPQPGTVVTVRPNGVVAVADAKFVLEPQPLPRPQPLSTVMFSEHMSADGLNYDRDHADVVGGWSRYAMIWKSYVDPYVGHVDLVSSYGGSNLEILLGAEQTLDGYEASNFTHLGGWPYDPIGVWMSEDVDSATTGILYAATLMHFWHTPVFVSADWAPPTTVAPAGAWYQELALEQLHFSHPTADDIVEACGVPAGYDVNQARAWVANHHCNFAGLSLLGGTVSAWLGDYSPAGSPGFLHHQAISFADLQLAYSGGYSWGHNWSSGRVGELIFDPPPEANEEEIAAVRDLAQMIAADFIEQVELPE